MSPKPTKIQARIEPSVIRALAALGVVFALIGLAFAQAPGSAEPVVGIDVNSAIGWPLFVLILLVVFVVNGAAVAAEAATDLLKPVHVKHLREKSEKEANRLQTLLEGRVGFVAACRLSSDLARL